ncbi:MAG: lysylphosphatidylglycerol synthase transmembrane domain-containing protein [Bacteroidales bacterium]
MKTAIIRALKFIAFLAAGIILLWLAFRSIKIEDLGKGLREANYWWLILALFFGTLAYLSRARRWKLLIMPLGHKPSLKNTFYAMMTGYLANMALPRVGEISKCVALGKKDNIPVDKLIGTVVIERTIDFVSLMVILLIMLIVDGSTIGPFMKNNIFDPITEKLASVFGSAWIIWPILLLAGGLTVYFLYAFRNRLRKIRFFAKFYDAGQGIIHGLSTITAIENKWEFLFHTVFIWLNYALMTWVVVFTVDSTSHLSFGDGIFLLVIGGLAMSAPVQSGLGAFHFIISGGLMAIYGISKADALVYAILSHESQMVYGAILGIWSFYALVGKKKKKHAAADPVPVDNY